MKSYSTPSDNFLLQEIELVEENVTGEIFQELIDLIDTSVEIVQKELAQGNNYAKTIEYKKCNLNSAKSSNYQSKINKEIKDDSRNLSRCQYQIMQLQESSSGNIEKLKNRFQAQFDDIDKVFKKLYNKKVLSNDVYAPTFTKESTRLLVICKMITITIEDIKYNDYNSFSTIILQQVINCLMDSKISSENLLNRLDVLICLPVGTMSDYCKGIRKISKFSRKDINILNKNRKYKVITELAIDTIPLFLSIENSIQFLRVFNRIVQHLNVYSNKFISLNNQNIHLQKNSNKLYDRSKHIRTNIGLSGIHKSAGTRDSSKPVNDTTHTKYNTHYPKKQEKHIP